MSKLFKGSIVWASRLPWEVTHLIHRTISIVVNCFGNLLALWTFAGNLKYRLNLPQANGLLFCKSLSGSLKMQWGKCDTLKSVSSVQHRMQVNVKPCFSIIFAVMLSKTKNEVKAVFLNIYSRLSSSFFLKMLQKTKIYKTDLKRS